MSEFDGLTPAYERLGVDGYYAEFGAAYRNPHEDSMRTALRAGLTRWSPDVSRVLDLACGSGEATLVLRECGAASVEGMDPFTGDAYRARTGLEAEAVRFEDIALGALVGRSWSLVVCSFALHLAPVSWLPGVCQALAEVTPALLIVTPHKRPEIRPDWGWHLVEEIRVERIRCRLYR